MQVEIPDTRDENMIRNKEINKWHTFLSYKQLETMTTIVSLEI